MTLLLRNVQKLIPLNMGRVESDLHILRRILRIERYDLGVLCTNDMELQELNKTYRNTDAPTDVLSFRYYQLTPGEMPTPATEEEYNIGDIVLGVPYIAAQCAQDKADLHDTFTVLLTHGLCHLLGHDHMDLVSWQRMYAKEMNILGKYNKLSGRNLYPMTVKPKQHCGS